MKDEEAPAPIQQGSTDHYIQLSMFYACIIFFH